MSAQYVVPLESNPDVSLSQTIPNGSELFVVFFLKVLNKYLSKLGVSEAYQLFDVYGLDDDALAFLPQPVKAIILLFPVSGMNFHEKTGSLDDFHINFRGLQNSPRQGSRSLGCKSTSYARESLLHETICPQQLVT